MTEVYEAPTLSVLGSFHELTLDDKCGTADDFLTLLVQQLDGSIVPDPACTP